MTRPTAISPSSSPATSHAIPRPSAWSPEPNTRRIAGEPGSEIHTDVCVIGAGPAGISLVRELRNSSLDVCLLESGGGPDWVERTQDLSRGVDPNVGWPYQPLEATRVRLLGGTSIVWEGACLTLDAADFQVRPWVPHSGWPIARNALEPYYRRAASV